MTERKIFMRGNVKTGLKRAALCLWVGLGCGTWVFAQGVDVGGGRRTEEPAEPLRTFNNRGPREVVPPAPDPSEKPTYIDANGQLEILIDRQHGYLASLRFPSLFDEADARSIDRYILLGEISSSELDDEVTGFEVREDADNPKIIVDCLNRKSRFAIRKIYELFPEHHEVIKTVELDAPAENFLNMVSVTVLSDATREGGYYYQYISHTASRYCNFPTAAIPESYFVNGRNMQSALCTVTRPDIDFTYGEVQLTINGVPEYMGLSADEYPNKGRIESMVTREGWQLPRGNWLLLGPGRGVQTKSWLYSATRGTHLMWHSKYHDRYFFPAFAPERSLEKRIDMAFDISFLWPHAATIYTNGTLELIEGDLELHLGGLNKRWENEPIERNTPDGEPVWRQRLDVFDAAYAMFESLDLGPRAWVTCGLAETMYTMGDLLADHMWIAPTGARASAEEMRKVPMDEYFRFVRKLQHRWPRFKLFNYERGNYYPHTDTIKAHPEFAFRAVPNRSGIGINNYTPHWGHYFSQLTDKYLQLQKEGVSLYEDWALPNSMVQTMPDGALTFQSYETCQIALKKMARAMRDAGGFFFVNQPSGPWADFGYVEGGSWDTDTQSEWRFWGDRLQLYKLHEFRPNTVVALDMMCDEFIHQCLLYNFVPNTRNRVGVSTTQSWAPKELIRLRWPLREASMAPVPLRPVPWETPGSPLETSVMTLPGSVYLGAYNHVTNDHTADLSVDLRPVIDRRPYAIWRVDITKGPWAGLVTPQGIEPHMPYYLKLGEVYQKVGYKFEEAETEFSPYDDAVWDVMRLKLPDVKISARQSTYFFLAMVPAVVRSVEGREVLWPVGSQPHIHIEEIEDGTLLVRNDYTEAIVAIHPEWLSQDSILDTRDEQLGWPTIKILPGTWRLKPDGRLLYENRPKSPVSAESLPATTLAAASPRAALDTTELAAGNVLHLQNGKDGYQGQSNDQVATGQWGDEGHNRPGEDGIFLYRDNDKTRYAHSLIRFNLDGQLPEGAGVTRAVLVVNSPKPTAGGVSVVKGYKILKPWVDGKTWWNNWGSGGTEPGYVDDAVLCIEKVGAVGNTFFVLDELGVQKWIDQPDSNHGLLLKSDRSDNGFHFWADGDTGANPPKLILEYDTK